MNVSGTRILTLVLFLPLKDIHLRLDFQIAQLLQVQLTFVISVASIQLVRSSSKWNPSCWREFPVVGPCIPQEQQMDRPGFGLKSIPQIRAFTPNKSPLSARHHLPDIP
jgi:hypothetical protein